MNIQDLIPKWFRGDGVGKAGGRNHLLETGEGDVLYYEQFRALRSKLEYKADTLGWKVVGVTSSVSGEGKTLCSFKVAASLASTKRKRVLLVDADIRKADLARGLGVPIHPGLTEYLRGPLSLKDVTRKTDVAGLFLVPPGTAVSAPADLLAGERFHVFVAEARKEYDMVLLDTPPVLPVADTMAMREQVDGYIFIYRAGFTPFSMFQKATEEIGEKKILGVVLNGVEPVSEGHYSHYYGQYYTSAPGREKGTGG